MNYLRKFRDKRIEIVPFGFGEEDKTITLYGAGSVGGSIFPDKKSWWNTKESIRVLKFSNWYKTNISKIDQVWLKINVEGAELEIIRELSKLSDYAIKSMLVSFDVDKVPSLKGKRLELIKLLNNLPNLQWFERTNSFQVEEWLNSTASIGRSTRLLSRIKTSFGVGIPISRKIRRFIKPFIPKSIWLKLALKFGPNRKRN